MQTSKPCPFCGSKEVEMVRRDTLDGYTVHFVCCVVCDGAGPEKDSKNNAIIAWNRRSGWTKVNDV